MQPNNNQKSNSHETKSPHVKEQVRMVAGFPKYEVLNYMHQRVGMHGAVRR